MLQQEIPQEFKDYARRLLGERRYACFARALEEEPPVSVRINPFKASRAGLDFTGVEGFSSPVAWAESEGCYLLERPQFTADPLFHAGVYYVQEAASMFLCQVLRRYVPRPVVALDLCAAPGGKSTQLRSCLPEGSLLVSNEPVKSRAQVLLENLTKWGHPDVVVTNSYPKEFAALPGFFDLLVADVPCSGEGMFRKEEEAVRGWSMDNVLMCRDRQRDILRDVWPALKPGGLLVYSTCTLNAYEDEENVAWIATELGAEVLAVETDPAWGVTSYLSASGTERPEGNGAPAPFPVYHFVPGLSRGEGFFLAVLRKVDADEGEYATGLRMQERDARTASKKRKVSRTAVPAFPEACKAWLLHSDSFDFRSDGDACTAIRTSFSRQVELLCRTVKVWQAGIPVAMVKGKDWMPLQGLALSTELDASAFPVVAVSQETAVAYLRKEMLALDASVPKGYVLITFQGIPLGFVKHVGGRANNLYPQEWKIRTSHLTTYCLKKGVGGK